MVKKKNCGLSQCQTQPNVVWSFSFAFHTPKRIARVFGN